MKKDVWLQGALAGPVQATDLNDLFTAASPCRCGYDGEGVHPCHAWRAPGPVPRCTQPGITRLSATVNSLAGIQMKVGVRTDTLCEGHWRELEGGPAYEDPALADTQETR